MKGSELPDFEMITIFGEDTEINAEQFLNKHTDIKRLFTVKRTTEAPPTTTTSEPTAEELDAEEDLNDDALEPEDVAHDESQPEEERKPDYSEETNKLIEG